VCRLYWPPGVTASVQLQTWAFVRLTLRTMAHSRQASSCRTRAIDAVTCHCCQNCKVWRQRPGLLSLIQFTLISGGIEYSGQLRLHAEAICDAGYGGQILMCQVTAQEVASRCAPTSPAAVDPTAPHCRAAQ
jgi:hypothetical protein